MRARSPLEALAQTPRRFGFDAAVRVLTLARHTEDPAEVAHFRSPPGLTYPPADVDEIRPFDGREMDYVDALERTKCACLARGC